MQYVRYQSGEEIAYGILKGDSIQRIQGDLFDSPVVTDTLLYTKDCQLLAPCQPSKIIGIGMYFRHLFSSEKDYPKYPRLFLKLPTSVVGPYDTVSYPTLVTATIFEAELAVVIGRKPRDVPQQDARDYVLGFTGMNDISSREYLHSDLSDQGPGDAIVKACDEFAPMGPCIDTEVDPRKVQLRAWLNGELKQDHNTSDLIFDVDQVVSYVSRVFTLHPGDVITTGTPIGYELMHPGDTIECEIEGIGRLKNAIRSRTVSP